MKPRQKRLALIGGGLATLAVATALVLNAMNSNLVFFFTPTQVAAGEAPKDRAFRIGGLVKEGSVKRDNLTVHFVVTDTAKEIPTAYTGILPDLFREGNEAKRGQSKWFSGSEEEDLSDPFGALGVRTCDVCRPGRSVCSRPGHQRRKG